MENKSSTWKSTGEICSILTCPDSIPPPYLRNSSKKDSLHFWCTLTTKRSRIYFILTEFWMLDLTCPWRMHSQNFLYVINSKLSHCRGGSVHFSSVHSLSCVWLFATSWIVACQASLSITNSRSSLRFTSIESMMPSSHLILCCPLLLLPSIFPRINVAKEICLYMFEGSD